MEDTGEMDGVHNAATEEVHEGSHVDFWDDQIRSTEADYAMDNNSDSEDSAPVPQNANSNSNSSEVGYDDASVTETPTLLVNGHSASGLILGIH
jgi:hypothetical protein